MFLTGLEPLMEKVALRRGAEIARDRALAGDTAGAERLINTPGVLKDTAIEHQLQPLGAGMEGGATLTAARGKGLAVDKLIDPQGIMAPEAYSDGSPAKPGQVAPAAMRGEWLREELKGHPDIAEFRGAETTPGGLRSQKSEYVPGKETPTDPFAAPPGGETAVQDKQKATKDLIGRVTSDADRAGARVIDFNKSNIKETAAGKPKAIDFMTLPPASNKAPAGVNKANFAEGIAARSAQAKGERTPYLDFLEDPRRAGNIRGQAYGGAAPITPEMSQAFRRQNPKKFGLPKNYRTAHDPAGPVDTTQPIAPPRQPRKPQAAPVPAPQAPRVMRERQQVTPMPFPKDRPAPAAPVRPQMKSAPKPMPTVPAGMLKKTGPKLPKLPSILR